MMGSGRSGASSEQVITTGSPRPGRSMELSMAVARPEVANWVPNPDGEAAMKTPSQPTHVVDRPGLKRKLAQWARTRPQLRSWLELINQEPRNDHVILDPSP